MTLTENRAALLAEHALIRTLIDEIRRAALLEHMASEEAALPVG
jgi:hypothetical protein